MLKPFYHTRIMVNRQLLLVKLVFSISSFCLMFALGNTPQTRAGARERFPRRDKKTNCPVSAYHSEGNSGFRRLFVKCIVCTGSQSDSGCQAGLNQNRQKEIW